MRAKILNLNRYVAILVFLPIIFWLPRPITSEVVDVDDYESASLSSPSPAPLFSAVDESNSPRVRHRSIHAKSTASFEHKLRIECTSRRLGKTLIVGTWEECEGKCHANAECKSYNWDSQKGRCSLREKCDSSIYKNITRSGLLIDVVPNEYTIYPCLKCGDANLAKAVTATSEDCGKVCTANP